jgi:Ti-type conjugative transfer relaxase TraA
LAIYHLTATVISRGRGQSVVAAAAYRSGARLRDDRYGITHSYPNKMEVAHAEIMAPPTAPSWVFDRETLWNRVEAAELRKDSQLARVIEVGLPIELSPAERVALLRDYIAKEFIAKGMIADLGVRRDASHNPHAHMLLTLRLLTPAGFGPKERRWNGKSNLLDWRAAWADRANEHLARAGHSVRIDHRTLEAQQIELTPGRRVGAGRLTRDGAPGHMTERVAEQQRIASANGEAILEDPTVVLRALTHQSPSFTRHDLEQFLRSRTDPQQFDAACLAVARSDELVALDAGPSGPPRFTSRDMIEAAKSLRNRATALAARRGHGVSAAQHQAVLAQISLQETQRRALDYLVGDGDAKALAIGAAADMRPLFAAAGRAWGAAGWHVAAATRSRSAQTWDGGGEIRSQPFSACEAGWQHGRELPTRETVLLVDGCEMMGLKQLERVLAVADKARAKLVLVGDSDRMRAMQVESPFHGIFAQLGLPDPALA